MKAYPHRTDANLLEANSNKWLALADEDMKAALKELSRPHLSRTARVVRRDMLYKAAVTYFGVREKVPLARKALWRATYLGIDLLREDPGSALPYAHLILADAIAMKDLRFMEEILALVPRIGGPPEPEDDRPLAREVLNALVALCLSHADACRTAVDTIDMVISRRLTSRTNAKNLKSFSAMARSIADRSQGDLVGAAEQRERDFAELANETPRVESKVEFLMDPLGMALRVLARKYGLEAPPTPYTDPLMLKAP